MYSGVHKAIIFSGKLITAVALLVGLVSVPSAVAASWSTQTTQNAPGAEHSALYDISCEPASSTLCIAVGKKTVSGTSSPYAQGWNGSSWSNQAAVTPVGATGGELQSAHCLSKTSCVASGSYSTESGTFSLIESWNGSSWSLQTTPNPSGASESMFKGVACKVITACIAVGSSVKGGVRTALAELGNSGTWSLQTFPSPEGALTSELNGVDCTSSTSCVAVGAYTVSGGANWALAAVWNGTSWTLKSVPKPEGAKKSTLLDVSCSDTSNCTAVGGYNNASNVQVSFVQRWNGSTWTQQSSPNPEKSANTVLQNVSCVDRYSCVGVGDWLNSKTWQTMAQYWNANTGWSLDVTVNPEGATFGLLEGVSCRITCMAIGWYTNAGGENKTLGEVRSITAWTQRTLPEGTNMVGISCTGASACLAVGSGSGKAKSASWNGTTWAAAGEPIPVGAKESELEDVSCTSASACTAVGTYLNAEEFEKPYAARYAAGTWTVQTVPLPAETFRGNLRDVSCTSATLCRAVGEHGSSKKAGDGEMVVVWNGTSWSVQTVPAGGVDLKAISCWSASSCLAVGGEKSGSVLIEKWNGSAWSLLSNPTNVSIVNGVSCTGESDCTVAGWGEGGFPVASHWNGSSWSQLPGAPRFSFSEFSYFEDISCTSASNCYAVGTNFSVNGLLVANWNGSLWTVNDLPSPGSGSLVDLSCTATTTCHAVGGSVAESLP